MSITVRLLCPLVLTSALATLASCAKSDVDVTSSLPPITDDEGIDAASEDAAADAAEADPPTVLDPSPPLQTCSPTSPCPVVVAAPIPSARSLVAISGAARDDVWAVGAASTVLHFDGSAWSAPTNWAGAALGQNTLRAVWLAAKDDVWFLDGADLVHAGGWKGASATTFERTKAELVNAMDLGGVAPNGSAWTLTRGEGGGANVLSRWSRWSPWTATVFESRIINYGSERLLAATTPDENTAWSVGEGGKTFRIWRPEPEGGADPTPDDWRVEEWNSHTTGTLYDVSAQGDEVWAVGARGLVRRLGDDPDGLPRFLSVDAETATDLRAIRVFAPNDVWIAGDRATILHFDGTSWWRVPTPFEDTADKPALYAMWGADSGDLWFVGRGITLRLRRSESKP